MTVKLMRSTLVYFRHWVDTTQIGKELHLMSDSSKGGLTLLNSVIIVFSGNYPKQIPTGAEI
jgi:hypothetical protein